MRGRAGRDVFMQGEPNTATQRESTNFRSVPRENVLAHLSLARLKNLFVFGSLDGLQLQLS